jgi:putative thioredoxin
VQEATDENFQQVVFDQSSTTPIVVDFWAEWCAPCRMLAPVLEKLAEEFDGKFILVKANTDQVQQAATAFSVSGIPAVFAVVKGDIVDSFQGVLPEDSLRKWLHGVLDNAELKAIETLASDDPSTAIEKLQAGISDVAANPTASILLARLLILSDAGTEAGAIIERLEARGFLEPEAESLKAQIAVSLSAGADLDALKAQVAAAPTDLETRLKLAQALAATGEYEPALIAALEIVELDRKGVGEKAREFMVQVFRVLPDGDELTSQYRRKLSMALY